MFAFFKQHTESVAQLDGTPADESRIEETIAQIQSLRKLLGRLQREAALCHASLGLLSEQMTTLKQDVAQEVRPATPQEFTYDNRQRG